MNTRLHIRENQDETSYYMRSKFMNNFTPLFEKNKLYLEKMADPKLSVHDRKIVENNVKGYLNKPLFEEHLSSLG